MRWISSQGGPLVVLPRQLVPRWKGATRGGDDYDLACSVGDYAGLVGWEGRSVLVLGDEPMQTAWWSRGKQRGLLRWMYAPDETSLELCLDAARWGSPTEEFIWDVLDSDHLLLDSGIDTASAYDALALTLEAGRQTVRTFIVKPRADVGAVVHTIGPA